MFQYLNFSFKMEILCVLTQYFCGSVSQSFRAPLPFTVTLDYKTKLQTNTEYYNTEKYIS